MNRPDFSKHQTLLRAMAGKYIWWESPEYWDEFPERVVAQVMRYAAGGEGDSVKRDQQLIERELGRDALRYVVQNAEPGWFPEHAWRHWHAYLGLANGPDIPPLPQKHIPL
jgi:hypothetical protein